MIFHSRSEDTSLEEVICIFREEYIQGRALNLPPDIASDDAAMQGQTYKVVVSRRNIFQGILDELSLDSYQPRITLEVQFMGENGQDAGGLRKEFLRLSLDVIQGRLMKTVAGKECLTVTDEEAMVDEKAYLVAGVVIGKLKMPGSY